ncbi:MAG TPA: hypothetical protein P5205_10615 [Candidatus Paceibacterota bacterium]|nr:hypothetical protein [Verrucomicrobiota bacterium]HSA10808.1 hypothetical protein [Candidatus Paceibacterota bacterium]
MKIKHALLGVTAGAALILASGCSKEEAPVGETPQSAVEPATASDAVKAVTESAGQAVSDAQQTAQTAATQAVAEAAGAVSAASAQVQALIDKAKSLVNNQKYQEALNTVQQLGNLKASLTPEQQKAVDGLVAQIQAGIAKAAGPDAASALGGALGGKK